MEANNYPTERHIKEIEATIMLLCTVCLCIQYT